VLPGASKLLVIDASVANAAGWSEHPDSSGSRHFLRAVLDICHQMVLTPSLAEEWRRHQSKYTREWRKSMYASRKIRSFGEEENVGLRSRVLDPNAGEHMLAVRLKDLPLIEAALRVDRIVVSLDEAARAAFHFQELNAVTWVNPVRERERMSSWLEEGAAAVEEWKLGYDA
jgi:hypothetical protein